MTSLKNQTKEIVVIILAVVSLSIYLSSIIPPKTLWIASFTAFSIPLIFALQGFILVLLFVLRFSKTTKLIWGICMLPFLYFLPHVFNITNKEEGEIDLTIASYNVGHFNNKESSKSIKEMDAAVDVNDNVEFILQLLDLDANVLCIQEFYQCEKSNYYNVGKILKEKYPYQSFAVDTIRKNASVHGVAIFSQFPIKNTGNIFESKNHFNRGSFADINVGEKIVRVVNVHLQSNQIKHFNPIHDHSVTKAEKDAMTVFYHLKNNLLLRENQAEQTLDFATQSSYPTIVAGDFNETAYGYIYNTFRKKLHNAFADAGKGFGITYQGKTLFFLRIDQQFYNEQLNCESLTVENNFKSSDHMPIIGSYSLK